MSTDNEQEPNRRRFHRILFDAPAVIRREDNSYDTSLIDISLKGALVCEPKQWAGTIGDAVELEIHLGEEAPHITMQGTITHIEETHMGIRCDQIDMESISHLRRLAELNLGDAKLVERELEALG
jgi:hypothetical protein